MIDEQKKKYIEQIAQIYAKSLVLYGVNIEGKYDTAVKMNLALENAYLRGRADSLKYAYEKFKDKNKWIPCSERLPECNEVVLVCTEHCCYLAWMEDCGWELEETNEDPDELEFIAWQPLPEPYSLNNKTNEENDHI